MFCREILEIMEIITFNYGELELPLDCLNDCHHQGSCDADCEFWAAKIDWNAQTMSIEAITKELDDYAIETKGMTTKTKREYILWLAAGNWQEEQNELN